MRLANGFLAVMFGLVSADAAHAQQTLASTSVLATVTFAPRPTLTVSAHVLRFCQRDAMPSGSREDSADTSGLPDGTGMVRERIPAGMQGRTHRQPPGGHATP